MPSISPAAGEILQPRQSDDSRAGLGWRVNKALSRNGFCLHPSPSLIECRHERQAEAATGADGDSVRCLARRSGQTSCRCSSIAAGRSDHLRRCDHLVMGPGGPRAPDGPLFFTSRNCSFPRGLAARLGRNSSDLEERSTALTYASQFRTRPRKRGPIAKATATPFCGPLTVCPPPHTVTFAPKRRAHGP